MYKLLLVFLILLISCTRNNNGIQPETEEEEIIIVKDSIPNIDLYDSLFFKKNDYLYSAKLDTNVYESKITLKDQNIYKVIAQFQEVDTNYILAMLLYKDNSSDTIYNDFPYHLTINTTLLKFSFPVNGIFRIKIE